MALEGKRPVAFESQGGAERSEEIPIKETQPLGDPLWFISPAVGVKPIRVGGKYGKSCCLENGRSGLFGYSD